MQYARSYQFEQHLDMYSPKKVYIDIAIKYSWACDQFHWTCRRFVIFISTSSMANFSLSWHEIAFRLTSSFSILYATCHLQCALHRMHKIFKACANLHFMNRSLNWTCDVSEITHGLITCNYCIRSLCIWLEKSTQFQNMHVKFRKWSNWTRSCALSIQLLFFLRIKEAWN